MRMSECSSDVCSSDLAEIAAKAKGKVKAFPCDVTDPQQIEALFPKIESTLGPVDILVNNAGSSARAPFLEITDAMWQADLDLKLFAAIRLCRLAFPGDRKSTRLNSSH